MELKIITASTDCTVSFVSEFVEMVYKKPIHINEEITQADA